METIKVNATGEPISIQDLVKMVIFSREILANEGVRIIPQTAASVAQTIALQIMRRFISILETNANLTIDSAALFNTDAGNLLTGAGLDLANLDTMIDAPRSIQTSDGENSCWFQSRKKARPAPSARP